MTGRQVIAQPEGFRLNVVDFSELSLGYVSLPYFGVGLNVRVRREANATSNNAGQQPEGLRFHVISLMSSNSLLLPSII